jgi:hypothetical protein
VPHHLNFADWSQAGSAAFTAATAFYAWRSVRLNERQWRTSKEPELHLEVLLNMQTGTTDISLMNEGGTARAALFAAGVGAYKAFGYIGDGFIKRGERVLIHCALPQDEGAEVMLMYRGTDQSSYATARGKGREVLRQGEKGTVTVLSTAWDDRYPQTPWEAMTTVDHHIYFQDRGSIPEVHQKV